MLIKIFNRNLALDFEIDVSGLVHGLLVLLLTAASSAGSRHLHRQKKISLLTIYFLLTKHGLTETLRPAHQTAMALKRQIHAVFTYIYTRTKAEVVFAFFWASVYPSARTRQWRPIMVISDPTSACR